MTNKIPGKVKWFKKEKGYGYISGYDGEDYYFEILNLSVDIEEIKENVEVLFIPNINLEMSYADKIELNLNDKEK